MLRSILWMSCFSAQQRLGLIPADGEVSPPAAQSGHEQRQGREPTCGWLGNHDEVAANFSSGDRCCVDVDVGPSFEQGCHVGGRDVHRAGKASVRGAGISTDERVQVVDDPGVLGEIDGRKVCGVAVDVTCGRRSG